MGWEDLTVIDDAGNTILTNGEGGIASGDDNKNNVLTVVAGPGNRWTQRPQPGRTYDIVSPAGKTIHVQCIPGGASAKFQLNMGDYL